MARVALVLIVSLQLALGAKKAEDPSVCEGAPPGDHERHRSA